MSALYILWLRQIKKYFRNKARIVGAVGQPLLFLIALGYGLGPTVEQSGITDYISFLVPGIVGMTILFTSTFIGIELIGDRMFGFLKETLVAPVPRFYIMLGKALGGATVAVFQGIIVFFLAIFIGFDISQVTLGGALIALTAAALIGLLFAAMGLVIASHMQDTSAFPLIINFVMFPIFFLSGALFPLTNIPPALELITKLNPFSYGVDAIRGGLVGSAEHPIWLDLTVVAGVTLVLLIIGSWLFKKIQI
ncbi:MAG: multidrug ABC transporter permease [Candidatus Harrisonbacteria bacterium CG10_big_fil_rev_8_21_14_0_10_49_15]|uniref:Transport permease protein n=1 Tax=Candidatus Harrisonbacteria bacterium CG10_big_fil_rev_8_21_14_0_10_49_15 TaxID=1974587 RepID=A0A2H0UL06_9BACT|nr:MAG: multidrug ABC transporter permease [Candidatus Harrisonbacteria bacterium CG10_big_fil_rev_8_21_14_0_10_49_15]